MMWPQPFGNNVIDSRMDDRGAKRGRRRSSKALVPSSDTKRRDGARRQARQLAIELCESRCLMAADADLFSFRLDGGRITAADGTIVSNDPRLDVANRMAEWVGGQLGLDVDRISDAVLSGATRDEVWLTGGDEEPIYTFAWEGMEWDIREIDGEMRFVDPNDHGFHNQAAPIDINDDGILAPIDALMVINYLNSAPTNFLPNRVSSAVGMMMPDVTGDRWVTPQDALLVINDLNDGGDPKVDRRLVATDDYFGLTIPASATEFPVSDIDVLANDTAGGRAESGGARIPGVGLRIVDVSPPSLGTAEIIVDAAGTGGPLVRYTPGDGFRTFDFFTYTVEDAAGNRAEATVYVSYDVAVAEPTAFQVSAPTSVVGSGPGASIPFRDAAGNGLISIQGVTDPSFSVGVLLRFQFNDPPYGLSVAGTLSSDVVSLTATFYPQPGGEAWITGPVAQVNAILAGLQYEPALGFSAPDGIGLNVYAFLYSPIGGSAGFSSSLVSVVVPADPQAPITAGDYYDFGQSSGPFVLDVLANDSSPTGSPLTLVSVAKYPAVSTMSLETLNGAVIEVDRAANKILFRPGSFGSYESFVYVVSDAEGRLSQGLVALSFDSPMRA